jgi:hypothetical protein
MPPTCAAILSTEMSSKKSGMCTCFWSCAIASCSASSKDRLSETPVTVTRPLVATGGGGSEGAAGCSSTFSAVASKM